MAKIYNVGTNKGLGIHEVGYVELLPSFPDILPPPCDNDDILNDDDKKIVRRDRWVFDNGPIIYPLSNDFILSCISKASPSSIEEIHSKSEVLLSLPSVEVLSVFVEDLAQKVKDSVTEPSALSEQLPVGLMVGACCCAKTKFGDGSLILFATHPEQGREAIVLHFLEEVGAFRLHQRNRLGVLYGSEFNVAEPYSPCDEESVYTTRYGFKSCFSLPLCLKHLSDCFHLQIASENVRFGSSHSYV